MIKAYKSGSITTQVLLGTGLCLFVLAILTGVWGRSYLHQKALSQFGESAQESATRTASNINKQLQIRLQDVTNKAAIAGLLQEKDPDAQNRLIEIMQANFPSYMWIGITDLNGVVKYSSHNMLLGRKVSQREWFIKGLHKPTVVDKHEAALLADLLPPKASGKYQFVDFSAPILDRNGSTTGVFAVHLDWEWIKREIANSAKSRLDNRHLFILGQDGLPRFASDDSPDFTAVLTKWSASQVFRRARDGETGWSLERTSTEPYLLAFAPMDYEKDKNLLNWVTVTIRTTDALNRTLDPSIALALGTLVAGIFITLALVYIFSLKVSHSASRFLAVIQGGNHAEQEEALSALPTEVTGTAKKIQQLLQDLSDKNESLKLSLEEIQRQSWLASSLIEQAPLRIAMLDRNMVYIAASELWRTEFGLPVGPVFTLAFSKTDHYMPQSWKAASEVLRSGYALRGNFEKVTNPAGEVKWLNWVIAPWALSTGQTGGVIVIATDVTELHESEQKLAESEERFTLAMEGSRDGLWDWNLEKNEVYYSPAWKQMLGYEDHELPNAFATWETLTDPDDLQQAKGRLEKVLNDTSAESFVAEFRMRSKSGKPVHVLSRALVMRDQHGRAIRVVGTHINQTEQREMEERVRLASITAQAERESNSAKSRFLATISHEIRTPLNGVIGYARLLYEDLPDGQAKENAESLLETAENLTVILNDILDYSKIEAGQLQIEKAPFHLNQLFNSAQIFQLTCVAKGIGFGTHNLCNDGPVVLGDLARLRQIVQNLVSNAIKFTQKGRIDLSISSKRVSAGRLMLQISVSDTGAGISKEQQAKLFKPFSQVNNTRDQRLGGTGLGLSIVKSLVKSMGGEVELESELGVGSTFRCLIPVEEVRANSDQPKIALVAAHSMRVLLADDSALNLKLIKTFLERAGHEVTTARDGQRALDLALGSEYDFILLDVNMPMLSGYEVVQQIRTTAGPNQYCEIAAITGFAYEEDVSKAKQAGFNYHFAKPLQFDSLLNQLAISSQESASGYKREKQNSN
ncbi:ATP-binding protein [Limnobacter litoralis]|uniref:histidine kinase n=1 Tax=Limnobacter litoralis TaxID=481366 RepID=A0ABQ5YSQ3_9BURK|nr:ATP-binding protein [Limnobacter litoralis]GLR26452.1 hypothetical protein GCM10007875_15420 [Limnobacter litoralis]